MVPVLVNPTTTKCLKMYIRGNCLNTCVHYSAPLPPYTLLPFHRSDPKATSAQGRSLAEHLGLDAVGVNSDRVARERNLIIWLNWTKMSRDAGDNGFR